MGRPGRIGSWWTFTFIRSSAGASGRGVNAWERSHLNLHVCGVEFREERTNPGRPEDSPGPGAGGRWPWRWRRGCHQTARRKAMRTGTSSRSACARSGGRAGSPSAEPCGLRGAGLPLSTRPLCGTLSPHNAFGALPSSPRPPPAGVGPGHAVRGPRAQSPFPGPRRQRPSCHRSGLGPCFRPARDAESRARARAPPAQCR